MNQPDDIRVDRSETLVTARCRLRYPDASDIPHIWSACQAPGFNDGLPWGPPASIADIDEPFRAAQARWIAGDEYSFAIESAATRDFIGWISIRRESEHGEWSIGFWIHPRWQGSGFATESAKAIIDYGFTRLNASLITARHAVWNAASGRVLEHVGMRRVRTVANGFRKNDTWVEEYEYAIRPCDSIAAKAGERQR